MRTPILLYTVYLLLAQQQASGDGEDTLYRGQLPRRPPTTDKPRVEDPDAYSEYIAPSIDVPDVGSNQLVQPPGSVAGGVKYVNRRPAGPDPGPSGPGPVPAGPPPPAPVKYIPKPFVPRPRKPVEKLRPNGPILYTAHDGYKEPRYGAGVQDFSKIPGVPGQDYPVHGYAPETRFTCDTVPHRPGLYADVETRCQSYHVCGEDDRHGYGGAIFLCANGTVFNQYELTCDWWFNVNCQQSLAQYEINLDPHKNPYLRKPIEEPVPTQYI